jgi:SPASM domain peptide maturase of grasp-with-spasm system
MLPDDHRATDDVFRLYASCKLVRGGAFSAIYDLERRLLFRFDSAYYGLFALAAGDGIRAGDVATMERTARQRCLEAIEFLSEREVGRYMDRVSARYLMPLPEACDPPQGLQSALVDVDAQEPDWATLAAELDALRCKSLQVRCFSSLIAPAQAAAILDRFLGSAVVRIELLVKWSPEWETVDWGDVFKPYANLLAVRVHSAPAARTVPPQSQPFLRGRLISYFTEEIAGADQCGAITEGSLSIPSVGAYAELRSFNGCLNRKLSIRADGQICNCPSLKRSFGTDLTQMKQIVSSPDFQRPWHLGKDRIEVCSGCEFRYVCTDCRAHLDSDESLKKPARCGYDPATGVWNAATGNVAREAELA